MAGWGAAAFWLPGGLRAAGQSEKLSTLTDGKLTVGADLNRGGAITLLKHAEDGRNLVNNHDCGRQIQQSYYSGPRPFDPNGTMHPAWNNWCWNPIQVGDVYGNRAEVVEHRNDGREIYTRTIPLHWALNNVPGECTFETWIRLQGGVVKVRCRLNNHRSDKTQYHAHGQELPALYTVGTLHRLFTYTGTRPFTGDSLERIENNGPPWTGWLGTENWAALVDEDDWGVGLHHAGALKYTGGFHGEPGVGGSSDRHTGYFAPLHLEILDHNITYGYEFTLIPGTLQEIRDWVYEHRPEPRPNYVFRSDRQHWRYRNAGDAGMPVEGHLTVRPGPGDPQMIGPRCAFRAEQVSKLYVRTRYRLSDPDSGQLQGRLYWQNATDDRAEPGRWSNDRSVAFTVRNGELRTYELDMSESPGWHGLITGLRFDPVPSGKGDDRVDVMGIGHDPGLLEKGAGT